MGEERSMTAGVDLEVGGESLDKGSGGRSRVGEWAGASFACSSMVSAGRSGSVSSHVQSEGAGPKARHWEGDQRKVRVRLWLSGLRQQLLCR